MRRLVIFAILLLPAAGFIGCGEEGAPSGPDRVADGAALLRLVDGDTLRYFRVDTIVTIDSMYHIRTDQGTMEITIDGAGDDWVFRHGSDPAINVKRTPTAVLVSGYWRHDDSTENIVYFTEPSILVKRSLVLNETWEGYTPSFSTPLGSRRVPVYFANFGFYFVKTYRGTEPVTVPGGTYTAHRYETELYLNAGDSLAVAQVTEHYVYNLGLVRSRFEGGGLTRVLVLVGSR
jgi:hypothetical protein